VLPPVSFVGEAQVAAESEREEMLIKVDISRQRQCIG
jgi:hypothetical protein